MDIKLSDEDMNSLADIIAAKLEKRVIDAVVLKESFEAVSESARKLAELHINQKNFNREFKAAITNVMLADGKALLREIVDGALNTALFDKAGMKESLNKFIREQAIAAANEFAQSLYDE